MLSIAKTGSIAHYTLSLLGSMLRPDHPAFRFVAEAAPKATFTVLINDVKGMSGIEESTFGNPTVAELMAQGRTHISTGEVSIDAEPNDFAIEIRAGDQTLVRVRFSTDDKLDADTYGFLFPGEEATRVAIAERLAATLEKAKALYDAHQANIVALANAVL